jgi:FAD synthase
MLNIGSRPTVNNNADNRSIEVHIFDFDSEVYGEPIELVFYKKLREEQKFSSLEALKIQLALDKANTQAWFENEKISTNSTNLHEEKRKGSTNEFV